MAYTIVGQQPYSIPGVRTSVRTRGINIPVESLAREDTERMYDLMTESFDNVKRDKFINDLREKEGVIVLRDEIDNIVGFSTWQVLKSDFCGSKITALFSGDTIVDESNRGQVVLFREYVRLLHWLMRESGTDTYWFLLSKGIKTYLILPTFLKSYYPCVDDIGTPNLKDVLDHFAFEKFGRLYDSESGIIRFDPPADRLKPCNTVIPDRLLLNGHVKYFLKRNPGYVNGDELACITKIEESNYTNAFRRLLRPE